MNGAVERCNGAWRYEFYETYELPGSVEKLNPILDAFQHHPSGSNLTFESWMGFPMRA